MNWTEEQIEFLTEWYPHFGSYWVAERLKLSRSQVKSKVDKLGINLLLKSQRLCVECRTAFQSNRAMGLFCRSCFLTKRKIRRRSEICSIETWMRRSLNTLRSRTKTSNLTLEYLLKLWSDQEGRCFYSGITMIQPKYGSGRNPYSPSVDRIDPNKGYVEGNVVWAAWIVNAGKNTLSVSDYERVCLSVVNNLRAYA